MRQRQAAEVPASAACSDDKTKKIDTESKSGKQRYDSYVHNIVEKKGLMTCLIKAL